MDPKSNFLRRFFRFFIYTLSSIVFLLFWIYILLPSAEDTLPIYPIWLCCGSVITVSFLWYTYTQREDALLSSIVALFMTLLLTCSTWFITIDIVASARYERNVQAFDKFIAAINNNESLEDYCYSGNKELYQEFVREYEITYSEYEFGEQFFQVDFANDKEYWFKIYYNDEKTCWYIYAWSNS